MPPKIIIPPGTRFNSWTTTGRFRRVGHRTDWEAVCACGKKQFHQATNLRLGFGCRSCANRRRFNDRAVIKDPALRNSWMCRWYQLLKRCTVHSHPQYKDYGGRGIRVSPLFFDFDAFCRFIVTLPGWDDPVLSLDRVDNDLGYHPGNLRMATAVEQARNKRNTKKPQ